MARALLISTYDLGRQPFGLASPAAWLKAAGVEVVCADLAKSPLQDSAVLDADAIAFFLPMHTATRLALTVIDRVRALNPRATLIAYGLYAPLNEGLLKERGVSVILGGEFEEDLVCEIAGDDARLKPRATGVSPGIPRLRFLTPDRSGLLPLTSYATVQIAGERRTTGYTEASRGCKHRCRHCPIVPVYDGHFRVVDAETVLADIREQVAAGARHITFGDPDFFNGPRHALTIVERLARDMPGITYDVTIKVEHLLKHRDALSVLRTTGCLFVTSAVESLDDAVLGRLEKGHTRADFERVVQECREAGLHLVPTFVAFTPWTTLDAYLDLLHTIDRLDLVEHVASIQLAIRLLVPAGSRMLELPEIQRRVSTFSPVSLTHPWVHEDPRVDDLQTRVMSIVGGRVSAPRAAVFDRVWQLAHAHAIVVAPMRRVPPLVRATVPYLNEPWYC